MRVASLILITVFWFSAIKIAAAEDKQLCTDIKQLIKYSKSQFFDIRAASNDDFFYDTRLTLPKASNCMIIMDTESSAYQCSWEFPYGDKRAIKKFDYFRNEIKNCIGGITKERKGQPVNHPDQYLSYYYPLPNAEVKVTLKNKAKMMKTFVSIGVDGFITTEYYHGKNTR